MTSSFVSPERVPHAAVDRLLHNFSAFQQAIEYALDAASTDNKQVGRWQRARSLLQQEYAALQAETEAFQAGDRDSLLRHAAALRLLARRMDGYALFFAGEDAGKVLLQRQQLLVLNAWQIAAAASGSEAAGL